MESFFKNSSKKVIKKTVVVSIVLVFCMLAYFKKIRSFLPPPEITKDKIIGFAQYNGYPINFDTGFFLLIVFLPVLILFVFSIKKLIK